MKMQAILISFCLCIIATAALATDPTEELRRRVFDDAEIDRLKISGVKAADELFEIPTWKTEIASQISQLVEASRYDGPLLKRMEGVWENCRF
jgi:hypothetical protein